MHMPKTIVEVFGEWSAKNKIQDERSTRIISRRRRNLQGHIFGVSMVIIFNDTWNHLTDYRYVDHSPMKKAHLI